MKDYQIKIEEMKIGNEAFYGKNQLFSQLATDIIMAGFGFILKNFGKSRLGHNFA